MVSAASAASTPRLVTGRPGWPPLHCAPTRPAPVASPLARPGEALPRRPRASLPRAPHRGGPGCGFPHLAARPQSSLPASPRAASPGRHHHIVDDQVRRGHRPGALPLPRAAAFAGPGSAAAAPIPLGRRSRRHCRHVKRLQPALLAPAPQTRLETARGRREGRRRGGAAARGGAGTAPTGPPSWMRAKTL